MATQVRLNQDAIISRTTPAVSFIDNPVIWSGAGWVNAKASLAQAVGAYKTHIYPFGLLDSWASDTNGKTETGPSLWATGKRRLTRTATELRLRLYRSTAITGGTPMARRRVAGRFSGRYPHNFRSAALGGGGGPQLLSAPDGFDWTPPAEFAVYKSGSSYNVGEFDVAQYAPTGTTYYVDVNSGNDSTGDGSEGNPWKSVYKALSQADVDVVRMMPGTYHRQAPGGGTAGVSITRSVSITKWPGQEGVVYLTTAQANLSWSLDGTYTNTYTTSRSATVDVVDRTQTDANGDFERLTLQASAADVDANPGSWYISGSTVYVRTVDDRAPDSDILVIVSEPNVQPRGDIIIYMEGIHVIGGSAGGVDFQSTATSQTPKFYAKNCQFGFAYTNGVSLSGVDTSILQGCTAYKNVDDGYNYHVLDSVVPHAIEIDCIGRSNGDGADNISNGSSIHDAGSIIRVNCSYLANIGPNCVDVGSSESWCLGCTANDSASGVSGNDVGFASDGEMWLDGCAASGNEDDINAITGGTIYTRNTTYSTSGGSGTITAY